MFGCGAYGGILDGYLFYTLGSGAGNCSILGSCAGRGLCIFGTDVLNIFARFHSASICLFPKCLIGLYGVLWRRSSMRSSAACVTTSSGDSLGRFFSLGIVPPCHRTVPILSWGCNI